MPTIPTIVSQFEWVKAEEYPPGQVFVVESDLVKGVPTSDLPTIDETYFLVGRTSEFDKFSSLPDIPIIARKVQ